MNKKEKIESHVQKALEQFDDAKALAPNPYFYTRVLARVEAIRQQRRSMAAVLRPALLIVLVLLNISTAVWYAGRLADTQSSRQDLVELLSDDLNIDNNDSDLLNFE